MTTAFKGKGPLPRLQTSWDLRAACNFIGGGAGTGLLIATAFLAWSGYPYFGTVALGLACIAFGLFMVWMEIGRPWRSMNLFFHPQTSWMTREGILSLPIFALGAVTLFYFPQSGGQVATSLVGVLAAGYLYCQARMLQGAKGIPSWAHPAIIPFLLATGLTEGMGLVICFPMLFSNMILAVFALLLLLRLFTWSRYAKALKNGGAPQASSAVINGFSPTFKVMGHLLPVFLLTVATVKPGLNVFLVPAAGLLAAIAGWLAKAVIITRAAQTHGFSIPVMPVRGQGTSSRPARPGW